MEPEDKQYLAIGEAAKILGVSVDTLRRWEKKGKIRAYRTPSNRRMYYREELEQYYEKGKQPAAVAFAPPPPHVDLVPPPQPPEIPQTPRSPGNLAQKARSVLVKTLLITSIFAVLTSLGYLAFLNREALLGSLLQKQTEYLNPLVE